MKYTMNAGKCTLTLDTETGRITGYTYPVRDIIKDEFAGKWDAENKIWTSDKLGEIISKRAEYLARLYNLKELGTTTTATATTANTVSAKTHGDIINTELVNGYDGFYQIISYADGTKIKSFVG